MRTFRMSAGWPARPPRRPEGIARARRVGREGWVWVWVWGEGEEEDGGDGGVRWDLRVS